MFENSLNHNVMKYTQLTTSILAILIFLGFHYNNARQPTLLCNTNIYLV